jgi:hypothetical protein
MNPLPASFIGSRDQRGWHFTILKRNPFVALLEKTKPPNPTPSYEIVIIRKVPQKTFPNGIVTPAHESLPRPEDWGTSGWTTDNLDPAYEIYEREVQSYETQKS